MTGNVSFLGDIADWFDATTNRIIGLRDRALEWVDPSGIVTGRDHPYLRGISGNPIAYVIAGQNLSLTLLQGMVDTLRFGNGIRDGGWGYAQDALRGISVVIPAFRTVRRVTRFVQVLRSGAARSGAALAAGAPAASPIAVAAADSPLALQPANTVSCTNVAAYNATTRTGYRLFASVQELAALSGLDDIIVRMGRGLYANELRALFNYLRMAGVNITEFTFTGSGSLWTQFERLVVANRRGVFLVTIDFVETSGNSSRALAHTLEAIYTSRGVRFLDTTGHVFNGIDELRQVYHLADLHPGFPIGFVQDSTLVADTAVRAVAGFGTYVRLIPIIAAGGLGAAATAASQPRAGARPAAH
jgi:hypothetical protein